MQQCILDRELRFVSLGGRGKRLTADLLRLHALRGFHSGSFLGGFSGSLFISMAPSGMRSCKWIEWSFVKIHGQIKAEPARLVAPSYGRHLREWQMQGRCS